MAVHQGSSDMSTEMVLRVLNVQLNLDTRLDTYSLHKYCLILFDFILIPVNQQVTFQQEWQECRMLN